MGRACSVFVALMLLGATCGLPPATDLPPPNLEMTEVLGPGDVVEVRIFNEPDLSGVHQLSENGTIRLPLIGLVRATGLTPDLLSSTISDSYNARFLKSAEVSLFVKERNSKKVFVLGQVGKPGPVAIDAGRLTHHVPC